jgi:predicted PurR-regulated permease PerM
VKRLALSAAVFLLTLGGIYLFWRLRLILLLLALAIFAAATVRPFVLRLHRAGLPLLPARLLVYALGLGGVILLIYAVSAPLLAEVDLFTNWLVISYENTYRIWADGSQSQQFLRAQLPAPDQLAPLLARGQWLLRLFFGVTQGLLVGLGGLVVLFALSFYWDIDRNRYERLWLSFLPMPQRPLVRQSWRRLETAVSRYIRLEIWQSLLIGFILWVIFSGLRLEYPILLALLGALAWFIPLAGALFIIIPVYWVGTLKGATTAIVAVLLTALIMGSMEYVIEPRFFKHRRYSPVLILLLTIPLVDALGLIGVVLAPPLAVAIQVLLSQLFLAQSHKSAATIPAAELAERHQQLMVAFTDDDPDFHETEMASVLKRLRRLIEEAETAPR